MKKLKRWNRGLMAGAILIIAVILFQLADQARFRSSIPEISRIIQSYETQAGAALANSGATEAGNAFLDVVEQFWAGPETVPPSMRYSSTRSAFYSALEDTENVFLPLAYEETLQSCRISKSGPGTCSAVLTIDSTAWLDRYGTYMSPFGPGYAYNELAEDFSQELETPASVADGRQAIRLSCQLNVTLQLSETEGTWKISCAQMYAMSSASSLADIQEVPV